MISSRNCFLIYKCKQMQQNQNIDRILQNQYICNFELEKSFVIASQQLLGGKLQNLIKVLGFRL